MEQLKKLNNYIMKRFAFLIFILWIGTGKTSFGQGVLLSREQATDTLVRIFMRHTGEDLVTSKVVTEMFYTDAPSNRIDSMYYEVMSMNGKHYITIDHDISYMYNKIWNISVYRQQKQIVVDSVEGGKPNASLMDNPFSIYREFLDKPGLALMYHGAPGNDTARLNIQGTPLDKFHEIKLFYLKSTGDMVRGEYILPIPEPEQPISGDTTIQTISIPAGRAYLMKMHYDQPTVSSSSGTYFSESSFFTRQPDGNYIPSSHFPGFRVTRREGIDY
jgi:hypothetical protein